MTTNKLKAEIQKTLDQVPDSALEHVLEYLKAVQGKSDDEVRRYRHLRRILEEDRELLERLAQ